MLNTLDKEKIRVPAICSNCQVNPMVRLFSGAVVCPVCDRYPEIATPKVEPV